MSEYYFFNGVKKIFEIERWFKRSFHEIVYLEHTAPVTFTIDKVTYAVRYSEVENLIYTVRGIQVMLDCDLTNDIRSQNVTLEYQKGKQGIITINSIINEIKL